MTDYLLDHWPFIAAGLFLAAVVVVIILLALSGALNCPPGQISQFWYYQPMLINKTMTLIPIFHCVAGT